MSDGEGDQPQRREGDDTPLSRTEIQQLVAASVAAALRGRESDAGAGVTAGGDPPTAGATPRRASGKWDGNSVAGWLARSGRRSITSGRGITRARARGESRRLW